MNISTHHDSRVNTGNSYEWESFLDKEYFCKAMSYYFKTGESLVISEALHDAIEHRFGDSGFANYRPARYAVERLINDWFPKHTARATLYILTYELNLITGESK